MNKLYCIICGKYRKFEKPKISYFLGKKSVVPIIWSARMKMKNYSKRKN